MGRLKLIFGLVFAILLLANPNNLAVAQKPYIRIDVNEGHVDSLLTIEGSNFTPKANVTISWVLYNNTKVLVDKTETDEEGNFTSIFRVPKDVGGRHLIIAEDETGISANITFMLKPKLEKLVNSSKPDVTLRKIEKGMLVRVIGSGGINGTVIAFDNIWVAEINNVKEDGSFSFDFVATGKAGDRVISLYNYTGEVIDYMIYKLEGVTDEDVAKAIIYMGESSAATRDEISDLYSKVSRLSIDMSENIGIVRKDIIEIENEISKNISDVRAKIKKDMKEFESSVKDSMSFLASKVARLENILTKNINKSASDVKNEIGKLKEEVPKIINILKQSKDEQSKKIGDLKKEFDIVKQRIDESSNVLKSVVSGTEEEISKKIDNISKDVKVSNEELSSKIDQKILQLQNLIVLAIVLSFIAIVVQVASLITKRKA